MGTANRATNGIYTTTEELVKLRQYAHELDLSARRRSQSMLSGNVRTRYRGRGMEFAEVRPYQAGDDIRTIDWRVTARTQKPYTKLFQEERERPVFVMLDQRSPMFFGSQLQLKSVYAAYIATLVGWAASANNDRIGALIFGDEEQADIRPKNSKHALMELINRVNHFNHQLQQPIPTGSIINIEAMLQEVRRIARPGSLLVLISDFHDIDESCAETLTMLSKHSDVNLFHVIDPLETSLPNRGVFTVSNSKQRMSIDAAAVREDYAHVISCRKKLLQAQCLNAGISYVDATTKIPATEMLLTIHGAKRNKKYRQAPGNVD